MLCFAVLTVDRIRAAVRWNSPSRLSSLFSRWALTEKTAAAWAVCVEDIRWGVRCRCLSCRFSQPPRRTSASLTRTVVRPCTLKDKLQKCCICQCPQMNIPWLTLKHKHVSQHQVFIWKKKSLQFKHTQKKERNYWYSRLCLSFYQMFHFINKNNVQIKKQRCSSDGQTVPTSATASCRQRNLTSRVC